MASPSKPRTNKNIALETVRAMRKGVTAKCDGGDVSRKRKLMEKQMARMKKMRQFGEVEVSQEAFVTAQKMDERGLISIFDAMYREAARDS